MAARQLVVRKADRQDEVKTCAGSREELGRRHVHPRQLVYVQQRYARGEMLARTGCGFVSTRVLTEYKR